MTRNIRILSIDGGGIKGIVPALVLNSIEERTGKHITELFDFIAGTSTGGILALLLATPTWTVRHQDGSVEMLDQPIPKFNTKDLLDFYLGKDGKTIFKKGFTLDLLKGYKYDTNNIKSILSSKFEQCKLRHSLVDVMVTAYDTEARQAKMFTSFDTNSSETSMLDCALATSSAPTFFKPYQFGNYSCVDGGLFANNPALCALVEAFKHYEDCTFTVVSLGTGSSVASIHYQDIVKWNVLNWACNLFDFVSDGQSDTTEYILNKMLPDNHYYRFQCRVGSKNSNMDDVSDNNLSELVCLGKNYITTEWNTQLNKLIETLST